MNIRNQIKKDLKRALDKLNLESGYVDINRPQLAKNGDYSTNLALQLAKLKGSKIQQTPVEIASNIVKNFPQNDYLEKIEVAPPGFINFFIKNKSWQGQIAIIHETQHQYGSSNLGQGKLARVEFVSANPTGPLHIGNARGGPLGDVLCNVFAKSGYKVIREYLHNDVGGQVKALGKTIKARIDGTGSTEDQYQGEYVTELAQTLKGQVPGKSDEEAGKLAVDILFGQIISDTSDMGISFDEIYAESALRRQIPQVLANLQQKGVIKKQDGALWFAPNDEFLQDRETVVVKSDGEYTYFAADIVYHQKKFASGASLVVDVLGSNHAGHVPRLQAVISALGYDVSRFRVILYQYVRVKRGSDIVKMSKRAGNFITAGEVLKEVGRDAFRFMLLSNACGTHLDFDLELAKKQSQDNPVYYVQYAHARICSILKKADLTSPDLIGVRGASSDLKLLNHPAELALIKKLTEFPELVEAIAADFMVHHLTTYARELADSFHHFYEACQVINEEQKELSQARLELVLACQIVLQETLGLLGVSAPETM